MYSSTLSLTLALDGGGWLPTRPGRFTPENFTRYPFYKRVRGFQVTVWKGAQNFAPNGIRSPDPSARSDSLYRLSYRGPHISHTHL
jgi:hypothetical protein